MKSFKANKGSSLEVKLRDNNYNPLIKMEIDPANFKQLTALVSRLKQSGIDLNKALQRCDEKEIEENRSEWW